MPPPCLVISRQSLPERLRSLSFCSALWIDPSNEAIPPLLTHNCFGPWKSSNRRVLVLTFHPAFFQGGISCFVLFCFQIPPAALSHGYMATLCLDRLLSSFSDLPSSMQTQLRAPAQPLWSPASPRPVKQLGQWSTAVQIGHRLKALPPCGRMGCTGINTGLSHWEGGT